jgi:hypothetical protein
MSGEWSVLAALRAGREQVLAGASGGAMGAIRALQAEVPAPVRDQAYHVLLDTAMHAGEAASIAVLNRPKEATVTLFDAAIRQLSAKLH